MSALFCVIFIPCIINRSIAILNIGSELHCVAMTNQRSACDVNLRSRLDVKGIILRHRLTTVAGLCSSNAVDDLFNILAIVDRIVRENSVSHTIQDITISIPSVNEVFICNTIIVNCHFHCNSLTVANGIRCVNCDRDFRIISNLDGDRVRTDTSSRIGVVALSSNHYLIVTSGSKCVIEGGSGSACYGSAVNIPLIGYVAGIITDNSFEIDRTILTNGGIADNDIYNRCTIYIYGEVDAFSLTAITAVDLYRIKIRTSRSYYCFGESVSSTCLNHIVIEIPCISGRSYIRSREGTTVSSDIGLQGDFRFT